MKSRNTTSEGKAKVSSPGLSLMEIETLQEMQSNRFRMSFIEYMREMEGISK